MTRTLCGLVLLFAIGCSHAPDFTYGCRSALSQSGPPVIQLQWVAAASCAPVTMPPSQPPFSSAAINQQADGSMIAAWPYQSGNRSGTLYARFVNEGGVWARSVPGTSLTCRQVVR